MNSIRIGTLVAVLTAATFTSAHAQIRQAVLEQPSTTSSARRLVDEQIVKVIAAGIENGFRRVLADERGLMRRDNVSEATFKVRLQEGVLYRIAARCDGDCSDIDLRVKDLSGHVLKRDDDPDDTPALDFRPSWTGDYIIGLKLAAASANRTQVGAVVLSSQ